MWKGREFRSKYFSEQQNMSLSRLLHCALTRSLPVSEGSIDIQKSVRSAAVASSMQQDSCGSEARVSHGCIAGPYSEFVDGADPAGNPPAFHTATQAQSKPWPDLVEPNRLLLDLVRVTLATYFRPVILQYPPSGSPACTTQTLRLGGTCTAPACLSGRWPPLCMTSLRPFE